LPAGLIFQHIAVSGFEPFIKALFRDSVSGTDPDPPEFIPFQEVVNRSPADTQNILQILNSIAAISGRRFGLNDQIIEIHIAVLLSAPVSQGSVPSVFPQVFFNIVAQNQFDIRSRIVVDQVIELGSFVHIVGVRFFNFIAVDQDDIAGNEFREDITAVHIVFGINDANGTHDDDLLSNSVVYCGFLSESAHPGVNPE
jgi:hypothetical protein